MLKGSSSNQAMALEIVTRAYQLRSGMTEGKLVSDHWDLGSNSSDPQDFATHGVTSFNSTESLNQLPEWNTVTAFIADFSATMLKSIGADAKITNMWTTIYPQGAFVPEHVHSNSVFSGVFYAKAEPQCGEIVFHDPAWVAKTMHLKNVNNSHSTKYKVAPETGLMLIFPSWLPHRTLPNRSGEDRIMISFNLC
jgi:uncharacterized protein (TIGR02466 family)